MVREIIIDLENKPGSLIKATQALEDANVDIRGLNVSKVADASQVRLIVDKTDEALQTLWNIGVQASLNDVIGVWVEDRPGSMNPILKMLEKQQENIQYIYPLFNKLEGHIGVIINTDNVDNVRTILKENEVDMI